MRVITRVALPIAALTAGILGTAATASAAPAAPLRVVSWHGSSPDCQAAGERLVGQGRATRYTCHLFKGVDGVVFAWVLSADVPAN